MFNSKKTTLFSGNKQTQTSANPFLLVANEQSAITRSENGAKKYTTTGNDFVDQFGKISEYKSPRSFNDISKDISVLWSINARLAIVFTIYLRIITRVVKLFGGNKTNSVQRGAGLKHESIMRMMWIAVYHKDSFWKNIHLFIAAGSWKDIITMLSYDLQYNGWDNRKLNWDEFGKLILAGLENPQHNNLIKKYLPQIKTNSRCTTLESQADNIIAKWICSLLFGNKTDNYKNYKKYRQLKSSGTSHVWQQLISQGKLLEIDFNTIHGRALALLVSGKFISNNKLDSKYEEFLASKPIVKYTGYVHELFNKINSLSAKYQIDTLNKQFEQLVETAKKGAIKNTSMIVARDTSGSMGSTANGSKMSCYNVAKALALFFSEMLPDGYFSNSWIEFNSTAKMHQWKGSTPYEKWINDRTSYFGSTNFQSVINLFCDIKSKGVSESDFPTGIICISDSEFNPTSLNATNVEQAKRSLKLAGFSDEYVENFKIVLWNLSRGNSTKFETHGNVKNVFYFSGLDGSVLAFLTGIEGKEESTPKTAKELFESAMDQELLSLVRV